MNKYSDLEMLNNIPLPIPVPAPINEYEPVLIPTSNNIEVTYSDEISLEDRYIKAFSLLFIFVFFLILLFLKTKK